MLHRRMRIGPGTARRARVDDDAQNRFERAALALQPGQTAWTWIRQRLALHEGTSQPKILACTPGLMKMLRPRSPPPGPTDRTSETISEGTDVTPEVTSGWIPAPKPDRLRHPRDGRGRDVLDALYTTSEEGR